MRRTYSARGAALAPNTRSEVDWRTGAPCLDEDPELFFPVGDNPRAWAQADVAKAVCAGCKVRDICLKDAIDTGDEEGVRGGTTGDERRRLRRRNNNNASRARQRDAEAVNRAYDLRGVAV